MGSDDACSTDLVLRLGFSSPLETPSKPNYQTPQKSSMAATSFELPSLTLGLHSKEIDVNIGGGLYRQPSPHSVVSLFSSGGIKRERDFSSEEDEDSVNARKKLRLTKQQSALLEECFKQHTTLNPKQKQALAKQLNLRSRQVEVWFQNRRARTKLKQTEVDCELLKKCCETLTDENRRLQKEVQELKALNLAQPMPPPTLTICPSCERIGHGTSKNPFSVLPPNPRFYSPFTDPSAAC
ncbi:ABA INSENSITIVE GROWTH 1 [Hibiscus trionum]|uniref:ABA INSENSITIVE GROWTH 1 n=1 Tax=Hibiscus trionum TaxID=183268 RepID=A0A9W7IWJ3_HIBTR|nr:ABA INSENSITIVE GROWTH 1 [Hibiscus trionum]